MKTIIITGASNGMGYEATKLFASKGWQVYAGARRVEKIPTGKTITALKLDVTRHESNQEFISTILKSTDHIDVLINNAGYGEYGPAEEIPMENVRKQFETNFFGAVELSQLVLPTMRTQKSGRIINISSIGGDLYMPLGSFYHATKAAMQQWSDALDTEVKAFGIRSIVIQPGGTASSWGAIAMENAEKNLKQNSPYQPLVASIRGALSGESLGTGATSLQLAELFYKAATDEKPKHRYFHSMSDRAIVHIARAHPKLFLRVLTLILNRMGKQK
ncbi:SDR family NAD(P)-dependent oxidoreductase [Lactococcus protaetiae]|uniref:SDR family NAD(P)-dependent oxidoreductase n=1 Tax=Lactococcus protaetiae TaxID=2592653 RepID=A0A514Z6S3_9LACT|nr:SDR family NAD(P)-dependent oxidoreductase [Lactococcus protaetiae]MCL2112480.1 SDR family NAD(P)-dependent oxidoreductase [Streptococcaceae bacterium]QDK70291.1 SDR family NAD(P)-dependent oxidoreductase [Lactococcus protaetiae]